MATIVNDEQKVQTNQKSQLKQTQEKPMLQMEVPPLSLDELIKQMINHHIGYDVLI